MVNPSAAVPAGNDKRPLASPSWRRGGLADWAEPGEFFTGNLDVVQAASVCLAEEGTMPFRDGSQDWGVSVSYLSD